jgi:hypothetical protein
MKEIKRTTESCMKKQVQIWLFTVQRRKVFVNPQEPLDHKISTLKLNASSGGNVVDMRHPMFEILVFVRDKE